MLCSQCWCHFFVLIIDTDLKFGFYLFVGYKHKYNTIMLLDTTLYQTCYFLVSFQCVNKTFPDFVYRTMTCKVFFGYFCMTPKSLLTLQ